MAKPLVVTATRKVWLSKDLQTLVADGDKKASVLFASRGHARRLDQVERFPNAGDFFAGIPAKVVEGDGLEELTIPQLRERCDGEAIETKTFKLKSDFVAALRAEKKKEGE